MGRGQKEASDAQRATTLGFANTAAQRGQQLFGLAVPQLQAMLENPGFSPETRAAITGESLGALGSAFDAARQRAESRAARTRNAAALPELEDELARAQGREAASTTRQNQIDFAAEAQRQREAALRGLTGLFGVNEDQLSRLLGIAGQLVGPRQAGGGGGFGLGIGPLSFRF